MHEEVLYSVQSAICITVFVYMSFQRYDALNYGVTELFGKEETVGGEMHIFKD